MIRRAYIGQTARIRASDWNTIADVARARKLYGEGRAAHRPLNIGGSGLALIWNASGSDLKFGHVLGVSGLVSPGGYAPPPPMNVPMFNNADELLSASHQLVLCGTAPDPAIHKTALAVLAENVPADTIGAAHINGYCLARFKDSVGGGYRTTVMLHPTSPHYFLAREGQEPGHILMVVSPYVSGGTIDGDQWGLVHLGYCPPDQAMHPFQIYSPVGLAWNQVRIHAGTINNIHPDNDDSQATPLTVTVEEGIKQIIWLKCSLNTSTGDITSATLEHGPDGWTGYPSQPSPAGPGLLPATLYIEIGQVVAETTPWNKLSVQQNISTSLGASKQLTGFDCSLSDPFQFRMAWWRV